MPRDNIADLVRSLKTDSAPASPSPSLPAPPPAGSVVDGGEAPVPPMPEPKKAVAPPPTQGVAPGVADLTPKMTRWLGEDYRLPTTETTAGWLQGIKGVDLAKVRQDLAAARIKAAREAFAAENGRLPTTEEMDVGVIVDDVFNDVALWSQKARGLQTSRLIPGGAQGGLTLVDQDPTGRNMALQGWVRGGDVPGANWMSGLLNYTPPNWRRPIAPLIAGAMGTQMVVMDPNAPVAEESTYNDGQGVLSMLDWVGRAFDPLTYAASAAHAGGAGKDTPIGEEGPTWEGLGRYYANLNPLNITSGWGTDEHLQLLSRGEDLFTLSDELELQYANVPLWMGGEAIEATGDYLGYQADGFGESFAQGGNALMLSLVSPDVLGGAVGTGAKVVSEGVPRVARLPVVTRMLGANAEMRASTRSAALHRRAEQVLELLEEDLPAEEFTAQIERISREISDDLPPAEAEAFRGHLARAVQQAHYVPQHVIAANEAAATARTRFRDLFEQTDLYQVDRGARALRNAEEQAQLVRQGAVEAVATAESKFASAEKAYEALMNMGVPAKNVDDLLNGSIPEAAKALREGAYTADQVKALMAAEKLGRNRAGMQRTLNTYLNKFASEAGVKVGQAEGTLDAATTAAYQAERRLNATSLARAQADAAFRDTMHKLLFARTLDRMQETTKLIAGFSDKAVAKIPTPADLDKAAGTLRTTASDLAQAEMEFMAAGPNTIAGAEAKLNRAKRAFDQAMLDVTRMDVEQVMARQDALRQFAHKQADQAAKQLDTLLENIQGNLGVDISAKDILGDLPAALQKSGRRTGSREARMLAKAVDDTATSKAMLLALGRGLETMGNQYGRLANKAAEAKGFASLSLRAAAKDLEDISLVRNGLLTAAERDAMSATGMKKAAVWLQKQLGNIADPARAITGMSDEQANEVFARTLGLISMGRRALVHEMELNKGLDVAGRVEAVVNMVDNVGEASAASVFLRSSFDGASMWQAAKPLLQALAADKEGRDMLPAIQALSRMWMPSGSKGNQALSSALDRAGTKLLQQDEGIDTFGEFALKMRAITNRIVSEYSDEAGTVTAMQLGVETPRAYAYGALATLQAAALSKGQARLRQEMGDQFTSAHWTAAQKLLQGHVTTGPEFQEGLELLNRLGQFPGVAGGRVQDGADLSLNWLAVGAPEGARAFVPRSWIKASTEHIGRIVKQDQPFTTNPYNPTQAAVQTAWRQVWRAYNASLITGLLIPRPSHFTNIFLGNFAQVWYEQGAAKAIGFGLNSVADIGDLGIQTLRKHIPGVGEQVDRAYAGMQAAFGKTGALASPTNAMLNPFVSLIFDPKLGPAGKPLRGNRATATVGNIRQWAVEQGVLSSFASSSGLARAIRRNTDETTWQAMVRLMGRPSELYADVADTIEQRQRMALFVDLVLNEGMTPGEAGKAVRAALYDWNYPMTKAESDVARNILMFWGFQRRAFGQAIQGLLEPVSTANRPLTETLRRTAFGSLGAQAQGLDPLKITRVQDQASAVRGLKHAFARDGVDTTRDYDGDGDVDAEDQRLHDLRIVYPFWFAEESGSRMGFANVPMGAYEANFYRAHTGVDQTHLAYTLPSLTPLEMTNTLLGMSSMMAGWASGGQPGDIREFADRYLAPMSGPGGEEAIKASTSVFLGKGEGHPRSYKGVRVKKQADRYILGAFDQMFRLTGIDDGRESTFVVMDPVNEPGVMRVDPTTWAVYKSVMTPLSYELSGAAEPFLTARGKPTYSQAALWVLTQTLGLPKAYAHDPASTVSYNLKDISTAASQSKNRAEKLVPVDPQMLLMGADPQAVVDAATKKRGGKSPKKGGKKGNKFTLEGLGLR